MAGTFNVAPAGASTMRPLPTTVCGQRASPVGLASMKFAAGVPTGLKTAPLKVTVLPPLPCG